MQQTETNNKRTYKVHDTRKRVQEKEVFSPYTWRTAFIIKRNKHGTHMLDTESVEENIKINTSTMHGSVNKQNIPPQENIHK